ncbi:MAG: MFS transporter [Gammaproteobacteria bacterium]|nr:MFS transporter [Gammaproteobacteria bacterium]
MSDKSPEDTVKINLFNLVIVTLLGFSSGIPIALLSSPLQAWLSEEGISIVTIGMLGLVTQPYVYKFLWAPFLDRFSVPFLGHRTGWIFLMQLALILTIIALAFCDPLVSRINIAILAFGIAFFSATQDVAYDAYRTEILREHERGIGSIVYVYGYRVAMLVSGGGSLLLSFYIGWQTTYLFMAFIIAMCSIVTLIAREPVNSNLAKNKLSINLPNSKKINWRAILVDPFKEFITRPNAKLLILLLATYKLGEAFSFALVTPFLIQTLDFTTKDVGLVFKTMGLLATLVGLSLGGSLINRLGLYRSLFWFGVLQAAAVSMFIGLAIIGHNYSFMALTVLIDQFASGLGTAALIVLLMSLCNLRYTATQFALLSAITALGRVYVQPISGYFVDAFGWEMFFTFAFFMCLPSLFILKLLKKNILNKEYLEYCDNNSIEV